MDDEDYQLARTDAFNGHLAATPGPTSPTIKAFKAYIDSINEDEGKECSDWYVGGTSDLKKRLFGDHDVETDGVFIAAGLPTKKEVVDVETHFQKQVGTKGCKTLGGTPGNGIRDHGTIAYAYLITSTTSEED